MLRRCKIYNFIDTVISKSTLPIDLYNRYNKTIPHHFLNGGEGLNREGDLIQIWTYKGGSYQKESLVCFHGIYTIDCEQFSSVPPHVDFEK